MGHVLATSRTGCLGVQNAVALAANPLPSCNFGRKVLTLAINSLLKCNEGYMHPSPLLNTSGMPSPLYKAVTASTKPLFDRQIPPSPPFLPLLSLPFLTSCNHKQARNRLQPICSSTLFQNILEYPTYQNTLFRNIFLPLRT